MGLGQGQQQSQTVSWTPGLADLLILTADRCLRGSTEASSEMLRGVRLMETAVYKEERLVRGQVAESATMKSCGVNLERGDWRIL